ncbi:1-acyl-sn-glycerol-3-phosphate acyltransferase [Sunxiuqinia dokdonensis]|uniref:Protein-N-phosphohistidine-sugar phosphotransferase n=1 Tax=Sunxiuqinia dokdonensis TaxID=1409788 RepID=A0A0L8V733_9BACT|nr:1-acyl-sn-glycerol-3-phosphate acyltransferase [Sunxiuqinia dokdonensis]KOH44295.1 protein-N-phosphohistidine-sugar phosphotransferase [Sunxiuqinia dokdonensis]
MKEWSLGYAFLKQIVRMGMWLSHSRITVIGLSKIPKNKPVIFAPNHQNALMDPLAVLCTNHTQPVWLARADIFKLRITRPILRFLKILPVYRIRDGKENLGENERIFARAIEILEHKKELALFQEAAHSGKRQMLTPKKAIPRIAFLAEEKNNFKLDLQIVPVGIYYSHYWHFNRELLVNYGDPIAVGAYENEFKNDPQKTTLKLRDAIAERLESLIINIRSKAHYENYELMRELLGARQVNRGPEADHSMEACFYHDQQLIKRLEEKEQEQAGQFQILHQRLDHFRKSLKKLKISGEQLDRQRIAVGHLATQSLIGMVLLPLVLLAWLLHLIPFFLPRYFIQKKLKKPEFFSTFQFVVGLLIYPVITVALALVAYQSTGQTVWAIVVPAAYLLLGKPAFLGLKYLQELNTSFRLFRFAMKNKSEADRLFSQKSELIEKLTALINS